MWDPTPDNELILHDGTAVTSTGAGSEGYVVIGDGANVPPGTMARFTISACDDANSDETYVLVIQGRDDGGTAVELCSKTWTRGDTGWWDLPFKTDQNGTWYDEVRCYFTLGGTTPSITSKVQIFLP